MTGKKSADTNEVEEPDYARVDTKLLTKEGEPIAINYNLHKVGADWKVYDVVIGNISIVNNYRAQFTRLLGKDSFPEVLSLLREKVAVRGELRTYWTKVQYPKSKMTLYIMRPKRRGRSELNK